MSVSGYSIPLGDAFDQRIVIAQPDLFDAIYHLTETGLLSCIITGFGTETDRRGMLDADRIGAGPDGCPMA